MPTNTYVALRTEVLTSAVPSVTFNLSGITGYTDLMVVISARSSRTSLDWIKAQVNGDTGTNYSYTQIQGNGTAATSGRESTINSYGFLGNIPGSNAASGTFGVSTITFMNYSNTTTNKTVLARGNSNNSTGGTTDGIVGLWRNTAAITSILFYSGTGNNFAVGSTFTIYGIAATSVGAKATGGTIYSDSSYFYHVFAGNGTFTPASSLTADVLCVAGGGGGGTRAGGGGGAGGLLAFASQSLTATNYTVTVGGGGAGAPNSPNNASGTVGVDSQFGALTLVKGGGFGGGATVNGGTGGSGGGGGNSSSTGGSATSGQGNAGAVGSVSRGGGAGGSGSAGVDGSTSGNGGAGISTYSSWATSTGTGVSGFYAGGGGGGAGSSLAAGTGGAGGGANGSGLDSSSPGANATPNTGGGGGGGGVTSGGVNTAGGAGGSGIVIIRYAK